MEISPWFSGRVRPIFAAQESWQAENSDAFWGPSVHWNTHLEKWVMLINRACCAPGWPQEGIYASFNDDLSNTGGWSSPEKILDDTGWYPQVLGLGPDETDSIAGERARFYIYGHSRWELIFHKDSLESTSDSPESVPESLPESAP
jgi:hypothetical protein